MCLFIFALDKRITYVWFWIKIFNFLIEPKIVYNLEIGLKWIQINKIKIIKCIYLEKNMFLLYR